MTLVKRFLESVYNDDLYSTLENYFSNSDDIEKVVPSEKNGAFLVFPMSSSSNYIVNKALEEVNKSLVKNGKMAQVADKDFGAGKVFYDIEEDSIPFRNMKNGKIDFHTGWERHDRFIQPAFGVNLPNGKKAVYIKTQEVSSEILDNGPRQMMGHHTIWLYEPISENPNEGYFILDKKVKKMGTEEDCIATWHPGVYGEDDNRTADEVFGNQSMTEEEEEALKKVYNHLLSEGMKMSQLGRPIFGAEHWWDDLTARPLEDVLTEWAAAFEKFFQKDPSEREFYCSLGKDRPLYDPFTIDSFYEIDAKEGIFGLPERRK